MVGRGKGMQWVGVLCLVACNLGSVRGEEKEASWKAGVASAVITPKQMLHMAGYAARKEPAEGKEQDLFAKALAIEDGEGNRVVFVTLDLIGVLDRLRTAVVEQVSHEIPVNLAFGTRTDLNALIAELGAVLGHDLAVERQPSRAGDVAHSQAEHSVLDGLFPDVEPVDLRTGLEATVAWFRTLAPAVGVEDA